MKKNYIKIVLKRSGVRLNELKSSGMFKLVLNLIDDNQHMAPFFLKMTIYGWNKNRVNSAAHDQLARKNRTQKVIFEWKKCGKIYFKKKMKYISSYSICHHTTPSLQRTFFCLSFITWKSSESSNLDES